MSELANTPETPEHTNLPALLTPKELSRMPIGMRVLFDDRSRMFFQNMAKSMADDKNAMTPPHLKGDVQLCFAIIRRALGWFIDPYEVAACTYNVKGTMGYYGKLIRAVMMNSGRVREIKYNYGPTHSDWERVEGKFESRRSKRTDAQGEPIYYNAPTYTPKDEDGLWCQAIAVMHDGTEVSTTKKFLRSCQPRNSTVWAYSPMKQIQDVLSRELAFLAVPETMFGANFDVGLDEAPQPQVMKDITPDADPEPVEAEGIIVEEPMEFETDTQPTKRVRLSFTWRGKTVYKTKFLRDIRQEIDGISATEEAEELHGELVGALSGQSSEHVLLLEECLEMTKARFDELKAIENAALVDDEEEEEDEEGEAWEGPEPTDEFYDDTPEEDYV